MRMTATRGITLAAAFLALALLLISSKIISESVRRRQLTYFIGEMISINTMTNTSTPNARIFCFRREPTTFGAIYQSIPIATLADFDVKEGDYEYILLVPEQYRRDPKFIESLSMIREPTTFFTKHDSTLHGLKTTLGYTYDSLKVEYFRTAKTGTRTIRIEYINCDARPPIDCSRCKNSDVVAAEAVTINAY